jgi:SAM-dependent methyltransferase
MSTKAAVAGQDRDPTIMATGGAKSAASSRERLDGRPLIINLGCGVKTSDLCVNVDFSIYVILKQNRWLLPFVAPIIGRDRVERINGMRGTTICHNLKKGIPFPSNSADAVYHSHLMEHIDRDGVLGFQKEIFRVLKPGGIQRVCVPDLERLIGDYNKSLAADDVTREASVRHDASIAAIFEQTVRRSSAGAKGRTGFQAWLENLVLGDARARGETHQWMWDRVNIRALLLDAGFTDISVRSCATSEIEGWERANLERTNDGREYKPESMYIECRKPISVQ